MRCANCNITIEEDDAYRRNATIYCCEGCANHTGCTCNREETGTGLHKIF